MESQSTLTSATVTDVSPRQIHRKPVLNGLINEDGARRLGAREDPQVSCQILIFRAGQDPDELTGAGTRDGLQAGHVRAMRRSIERASRNCCQVGSPPRSSGRKAALMASVEMRTPVGGHPVVALGGDLDITGAAAAAAAVTAAAGAGQHLIIDLAALEFIDCNGIRALLGAQTLARQAGGDMLLAAAGPRAAAGDPAPPGRRSRRPTPAWPPLPLSAGPGRPSTSPHNAAGPRCSGTG